MTLARGVTALQPSGLNQNLLTQVSECYTAEMSAQLLDYHHWHLILDVCCELWNFHKTVSDGLCALFSNKSNNIEQYHEPNTVDND